MNIFLLDVDTNVLGKFFFKLMLGMCAFVHASGERWSDG